MRHACRRGAWLHGAQAAQQCVRSGAMRVACWQAGTPCSRCVRHRTLQFVWHLIALCACTEGYLRYIKKGTALQKFPCCSHKTPMESTLSRELPICRCLIGTKHCRPAGRSGSWWRSPWRRGGDRCLWKSPGRGLLGPQLNGGELSRCIPHLHLELLKLRRHLQFCDSAPINCNTSRRTQEPCLLRRMALA